MKSQKPIGYNLSGVLEYATPRRFSDPISLNGIQGVYALVCTRKRKIYVGKADNLKARLDCHKVHLSKGTHQNQRLQSDFSSEGLGSFEVWILAADMPRSVSGGGTVLDLARQEFSKAKINVCGDWRESFFINVVPSDARYNIVIPPLCPRFREIAQRYLNCDPLINQIQSYALRLGGMPKALASRIPFSIFGKERNPLERSFISFTKDQNRVINFATSQAGVSREEFLRYLVDKFAEERAIFDCPIEMPESLINL
jgi:group I intron endonuclease